MNDADVDAVPLTQLPPWPLTMARFRAGVARTYSAQMASISEVRTEIGSEMVPADHACSGDSPYGMAGSAHRSYWSP